MAPHVHHRRPVRPLAESLLAVVLGLVLGLGGMVASQYLLDLRLAAAVSTADQLSALISTGVALRDTAPDLTPAMKADLTTGLGYFTRVRDALLAAPPPPPPPPPPSASNIWGGVDAEILGTCSAAVHDRYVVDGGDGFLYRTWHPQRDPSGCTFAHEHGDNPARQANALVGGAPVRFGYIGRRMDGHAEPHEGFKVAVGNRGANFPGETRIYLHDSRIVFHMGTGGPKRFDTRFHSVEFRLLRNDGARMFLQTMADTGNVGCIVQRDTQPSGNFNRTVMVLGCRPPDGSVYEIWRMALPIVHPNAGQIAYGELSAAAFDPITVMDPLDHARVVYLWDRFVDALVSTSLEERQQARGCRREVYHGPGYWKNSTGQSVFQTDAMGRIVAGGPLRQEITATYDQRDYVANTFGESQMKLSNYACAAGLGLKN